MRQPKLRPRRALEAIYIDFEGRTGRHPVLLGVLPPGGDVVHQIVVEPTFADVAHDTGLSSQSLLEAIESITRAAENVDVFIVGWSLHEVEVVRNFCPEELSDRIHRRYRNALSTARRWRNRCFLELEWPRRLPGEPSNQLARYLELIGYEVPEEFGRGRTGDTLRLIEGAIARGRPWRSGIAKEPARWDWLLGHNRHDLLGMREVCLAATRRARRDGSP